MMVMIMTITIGDDDDNNPDQYNDNNLSGWGLDLQARGKWVTLILFYFEDGKIIVLCDWLRWLLPLPGGFPLWWSWEHGLGNFQ